MNDGKADPKGRVFFGTMNRLFAGRTGAFYRLSKKNDLVQLFDGVGVSNGLVWSNDAKTMYYIDSRNQSVTGYDYNLRTGDMSKDENVQCQTLESIFNIFIPFSESENNHKHRRIWIHNS